MTDKSYTKTFRLAQSAEMVFAAITNPRGWWGEGITGETAKLGGEFNYRHMPFHDTTQKITALEPNTRVVWAIVKSAIHFVENKNEWLGTEMIFDISPSKGKTELKVTHRGLDRKLECFDACSGGWDLYLESLKDFIETGTGQPDPVSKAA
ncbi:SRPBCC family protein [Aestuariivirga litoralis]|uniref:SRPBCC family protein n=1 Tax=Aestuariivirga litoralis TaxID=2650924 RepID=UPI0018C7EF1D|nr:SRPBCC domain-containing protein [Aestuariivirga litoralis]MBG1232121.1 SRPBCC domain-containing protein [Aestuariivirga litoralis]